MRWRRPAQFNGPFHPPLDACLRKLAVIHAKSRITSVGLASAARHLFLAQQSLAAIPGLFPAPDERRIRFREVDATLSWLLEYAPSRLTGTGACVFAEFDTESAARQVLLCLPGKLAVIHAKSRITSVGLASAARHLFLAQHSWLLEYAPSRLTGTGACVFAEFDTESAARQVLETAPDATSGTGGRCHRYSVCPANLPLFMQKAELLQ
jgi:hypothetical protein